MAPYQVTNAEYARFLAATSGSPPPNWNDANFNDPQMPVVATSWHEAASYCKWLSGAAGKRYRLPSEAEWETRRACWRGGFAVSVGRCASGDGSRLRQTLEAGTGAGGTL